MLPAKERADAVVSLLDDAGDYLTDLGPEALLRDHNAIRDAGAWCLRAVYEDVARSSGANVSTGAIEQSFRELLSFGEVIHEHRGYLGADLSEKAKHDAIGAFSELGVAATIIGGVADGYYKDGYAILGAERRGQRKDDRTDVDIRGSIDGKTRKLQVKTGLTYRGKGYEKGIIVVSAAQLGRGVAMRAVSQTREAEPLGEQAGGGGAVATLTKKQETHRRRSNNQFNPVGNLLVTLTKHPDRRHGAYLALQQVIEQHR